MISYVLNGRFPTIKAYGLQVAKTCEGLKRAGAEINLLVPIRKLHKEQYGKTWQELYGVKENIPLVRLPSLDLTWLGLGGKFLFAVQQFSFAFFAWLYILFKRGPVYSRDQFTLYLLSFFGGHSLYWEVHRMPENLNSFMYRRLLSRLAGIVVISGGLKKELSNYIKDSKILVAPDGIDPEEFKAAENISEIKSDLGLAHDKKIVIYTGHLFEWKGVETLISAAQDFDDQIQTVIVGGTEEDISRLRKKDGAGKIKFEGFKPHREIPRYLAAADIAVLPNQKDSSISEFYTSPLKMFEYMAAGKPIVASDLPSIREVLSEENAVLVAPDKPEALRNAIDNLLQNPEKMAELGRNARIAAAKYTWSERGRRIRHFIYGISD